MAKTAAKLVELNDSLRLKAVLRDETNGRANVMVRNITGTADMMDTLMEISTRASNDTDQNLPPLPDLTCTVTYDMLKRISTAKYGYFTKGRLSLWQCCNVRGGWKSTTYFNRETSSGAAKTMDTQKELLQLTKKMMEMEDFLDASKNLQISLEEWASPANACELAAWTDLLSKWYLSILPEDREKKATVALLFDWCDAMLDMGC